MRCGSHARPAAVPTLGARVLLRRGENTYLPFLIYGLFAAGAPPMFKPASHGEVICGGIPPKGW